MSVLPPPPYRVPLLDPRTGLLTHEWTGWLQAVIARVGGVGDGPALDDVADQALTETAWQAQLATVLRRLNDLETLTGYQVPVPAQTVAPDVADPWLGAHVGTVRQALSDLETREGFGW